MTIGERNNNPLNIRRVKGQHWKGEESPAPFPPPSEGTGEAVGAFCRFRSVPWGLRAAFCILRTYRDRYKAVCIEDIITRWAPPTENDTDAYIKHVCWLTGFGGKERLTENAWPLLVGAMAFIESGTHISTETIQKGYELYKGNEK